MLARPGEGLDHGRTLKVEGPGFSDDADGDRWSAEED